MAERPILFSAPMVRAILNGSKTQTRLVVEPQPTRHYWEGIPGYELQQSHMITPDGGWLVKWWHTIPQNPTWDEASRYIRCPCGQPGDRLWLKEAWMPDPPNDGTWGYTAWAGVRTGKIAGVPERFRHPQFCNYAATWPYSEVIWTPSIHMPRWASRITLQVTGVRVERLQDISEADAMAEGVPCYVCGRLMDGRSEDDCHCFHRDASPSDYRKLWESIHPEQVPLLDGDGKKLGMQPNPARWDANPWVWAVSFMKWEVRNG